LPPTAGSALYISDSSAVDVQKYRQLYVAAGSGPSSAVSLAPSAAAAAAVSPAVVAAAAVKPPASIITPNIHQPPPSLPPFPAPVQVKMQCSAASHLNDLDVSVCVPEITRNELQEVADFCGRRFC